MAKNSGPNSGGLIKPKTVRCAIYSRSPIVDGLCNNSTNRGSGASSSPVIAGSRNPLEDNKGFEGTRETALASIKCGSSSITDSYRSPGRSIDDGADHPACGTAPHGGRSAVIESSTSWIGSLLSSDTL